MQNEETAIDKLIIDYLSGTISDIDEVILLDYLKSDEKIRIQLSEMAKTRAISFVPILEQAKQSNFEHITKSLQKSVIFPKSTFLKYFRQIAAIFLLSVATGVSSYILYSKFVNSEHSTLLSQTIVPLGSHAKVVLPDGSVVWLNSGSVFKYDSSYGQKERKVSLVGEGYFKVAKDKKKPFLVSTKNLEIKVLGTVFNVDAYLEDATAKVDLLEGKVDVTTLGDKIAEKETLLPNEMVIYNKKSKEITKGKSEASKSAQWTTDKLTFVNESMEKILHDLERKFDVHFVIESEKIKTEIFSGSINLNQPLNAILDYIDVDKKFERSYKGKIVHIKDRN